MYTTITAVAGRAQTSGLNSMLLKRLAMLANNSASLRRSRVVSVVALSASNVFKAHNMDPCLAVKKTDFWLRDLNKDAAVYPPPFVRRHMHLASKKQNLYTQEANRLIALRFCRHLSVCHLMVRSARLAAYTGSIGRSTAANGFWRAAWKVALAREGHSCW